MVAVKLWGGLSDVMDGQQMVEVEAKTIRELFRKLSEDYPGVEAVLSKGVMVSIDGALYRDNWTKELPDGADIYLLPRMAGG